MPLAAEDTDLQQALLNITWLLKTLMNAAWLLKTLRLREALPNAAWLLKTLSKCSPADNEFLLAGSGTEGIVGCSTAAVNLLSGGLPRAV